MITITVETLREALRGFSKLALATQKLPVLQYLKLRQSDGTLTLTGTNLDHTLIYRTGIRGVGNGECLVPITALQSAVKGRSKARNKVVEVQIDPEAEKPAIHVYDDGILTELSYEGMPLKEFPEVPKVTETCIPCLSAEAMSAIIAARGFTSSDPSRYILRAVCITADRIVATDGRQLYRSESMQIQTRQPVLLPPGGGRDLLQPESAALYIGRGKKGEEKKEAPPVFYRLAQGPWEWLFQKVEGKFPDVDQVIPKDKSALTDVVFSEEDISLLRQIERLPFASEPEPFSAIRRAGDSLLLLVGGKDKRQVYRLQPTRMTGVEETTVCFNYSYLMHGLGNHCRKLRLGDALHPLQMVDGEKLVLFMPLRGDVQESEWQRGVIQPLQDKPAEDAREAVQSAKPTPPVEQKEKAAVAALKASPAPVLKRKVEEESSEDSFTLLLREAGEIRERMRETMTDLGKLVKSVRAAHREHNELSREHCAVKRTIRSLQTIST